MTAPANDRCDLCPAPALRMRDGTAMCWTCLGVVSTSEEANERRWHAALRRRARDGRAVRA